MRQRCEITLFVFVILFLFFGEVFAGGGVYWQENGIQVCSYPSQGPKNVFDGKRSAIIVWFDRRNIDTDDDIYGQRIDIDGNFIWQVDGVPVAITSGPLMPPGGVIGDGKGGVITAWVDGRQWWITGGDIYAQRLDSLGNRLWGNAGTPVCMADSEQENLSMVSDGEGGAIIVWEDGRNGYFYNTDLYAQRIDSSGVLQWQYNGVPVCTAEDHQTMPDIIEDNEGGAVIVWCDRRTIGPGVYCQRLDSLGTELWGHNGVEISTGSWIHGGGLLCSSGTAFIVVFGDKRSGNWGIYAQRIRNDGSIVWDSSGIPVCSDPAQVLQFDVVSDDQGGAVIIWEDGRNGNHDIYAQRIDSLGYVYWQENGVYVCTAADSSAESILIEAVSDERSGVILAWCPWDSPEDPNIYAQRVDSLGVCQWDSNGIPVCTTPGLKRVTGICSDGEGGAIISWGEGHVCAQRVGDNPPSVEERRNQRQCIRGQGLLILHPNPFTQTMRVEYVVNSQWSTVKGESETGEQSVVSLKIYDMSGRLIRTLVDGVQSSGIHRVEWNGNNEDGIRVKPGIYYVRLRTFHFEETKKIIYIR